MWIQTLGVVALAVWWGNPVGYVLAFLLMGRADAQFAALMHEAAHRLLFADKRLNDFVGRWIVGYPIFTSTDAYRRVHMAHHRHEFGPDEPDIPLYSGYPITPASFRRKLVRDATGRTGFRLFRDQFAPARWKDSRRASHVARDPAGAGGAPRRRDRGGQVVALPAALGAPVHDGVARHQPVARRSRSTAA